ncbi:hypothetical protein, partial [Okeania sp. SIO2B9]|uniref:hypothetical protein n=1 Tax=Okeania sp. SIO2B9 TaxID=2607782 RepID=UPI00257DEAEF
EMFFFIFSYLGAVSVTSVADTGSHRFSLFPAITMFGATLVSNPIIMRVVHNMIGVLSKKVLGCR